MKILGVETKYKNPKGEIKTSAVDWWRTINPLTHLARNTDWKIDIKKDIIPVDMQQVKDWQLQARILETLPHDYDVVHYSYLYNGFGFSALQILERDYGLIHSMDLDDDLLNMSEHNPVYRMFREEPKVYEQAKWILEEAPRMTLSTQHLQRVVRGHKKRKDTPLTVLPNMIDLEVYKTPQKVKHDKIRIIYQGGATHFQDLIMTDFGMALAYILGKYENVEFRIVGFTPDTSFERLPRVTHRNATGDFYQWVEIWKEEMAQADIGVIPLADHAFNLSKSNIKWLEYSCAKLPTVCQNFPTYDAVEDGKTGLKVSNGSEWVRALETLIRDETKRKEYAENAYCKIEKDWNIASGWVKYKDYFESLKQQR